MKITKKQFIESIKALEAQHRHDSKCSDAFKVILPEDYITSYKNSFLHNQLVNLIEKLTNDRMGWIDYYIYELDYGKEYEDGMVKNKDGNNISLKTPTDLWNLLNDK